VRGIVADHPATKYQELPSWNKGISKWKVTPVRKDWSILGGPDEFEKRLILSSIFKGTMQRGPLEEKEKEIERPKGRGLDGRGGKTSVVRLEEDRAALQTMT